MSTVDFKNWSKTDLNFKSDHPIDSVMKSRALLTHKPFYILGWGSDFLLSFFFSNLSVFASEFFRIFFRFENCTFTVCFKYLGTLQIWLKNLKKKNVRSNFIINPWHLIKVKEPKQFFTYRNTIYKYLLQFLFKHGIRLV